MLDGKLLFFVVRENIDERAVFGPDIFTAGARPSFDASSFLLKLPLACLFGLEFGFNEEEDEEETVMNSATKSKANFASFVLVRSFRKNCKKRASFPLHLPLARRAALSSSSSVVVVVFFPNGEARETLSAFGSETTVPSVLR